MRKASSDRRNISPVTKLHTTRNQAVNLEQFGRPILESSSVECPATHMSEALPFAEIKLGSLQGFLRPSSVGDVLHGAEHLIGPARCVSLQIAPATPNPVSLQDAPQ